MHLSFPGSKGKVWRYFPREALLRYMDFVADREKSTGAVGEIEELDFLSFCGEPEALSIQSFPSGNPCHQAKAPYQDR